MLTREAALRVIASALPPAPARRRVPLAQAWQRVLCEDVRAEADQPPFEKSSMDGWAVRAAETGQGPLRVAGRILAGDAPGAVLPAGSAWKIMTGAPLPEGADAVVMVEQSEMLDGGFVQLNATATAGQNVCHRGEDVRRGDVVAPRGTLIDACTSALLASAGADPAPVHALPTIAVIPTGDELVPSHGPAPAPGQIRESNGALLEAQVRSVSAALSVVRPGIARDDEALLLQHLDVGLGHDLLLLSGGVSMGDADLVPLLLRQRGLEVLIEKVAIKPGKPLLFGRVRNGQHCCHVFGLPGNPVSSFVTFEVFVRPFLLGWMGASETRPRILQATLTGTQALKRLPRFQHVPCSLRFHEDRLEAQPLPWHGSADLRGLAGAAGLLLIPEGEGRVQPGEKLAVHLLPGGRFDGPAAGSRNA